MAYTIDLDSVLDEALDSGTFDVLSFVKGAATPEDDITVYTNADAALKLAKIFVAEAARAEKAKGDSLSLADEDPDEGPDEDEITALHQQLTASALVFHLKGLAPAAVTALENHLKATLSYKEGAENEEFTKAFNNTLIAKTIQSVTRKSDGRVNPAPWTPEQVEALNESLYISEANKLFNGAAEVNYVGAIFDRAVSADFS